MKLTDSPAYTYSRRNLRRATGFYENPPTSGPVPPYLPLFRFPFSLFLPSLVGPALHRPYRSDEGWSGRRDKPRRRVRSDPPDRRTSGVARMRGVGVGADGRAATVTPVTITVVFHRRNYRVDFYQMSVLINIKRTYWIKKEDMLINPPGKKVNWLSFEYRLKHHVDVVRMPRVSYVKPQKRSIPFKEVPVFLPILTFFSFLSPLVSHSSDLLWDGGFWGKRSRRTGGIIHFYL